MSRKIVGPEVVQQRIDTRNQNNMWNYIAKINPKLENNPIDVDTITVTLDWVISESMINQLKEAYTGTGWEVDVGVGTNETTFEFTAP